MLLGFATRTGVAGLLLLIQMQVFLGQGWPLPWWAIVSEIAAYFFISAVVTYPWWDSWKERQARREINRIEARFPALRATHFGHNRDILLTDRTTGTAQRELQRGRDF